MKTRIILTGTALAALLLAGCNRSRTVAGFRLPSGDADRGRAAFIALECCNCHQIGGVELPAPTIEKDLVVVLGGEVSRLRSYGDLMTSIIHPSSTISEKAPLASGGELKHPMKNVNDRMTVAQMVDLVTFLHPRYHELRPLYDPTLIR